MKRWGADGQRTRGEGDPLPQRTRRSFLKASIPLEKGDKGRNPVPLPRWGEGSRTSWGSRIPTDNPLKAPRLWSWRLLSPFSKGE